MKNNSLLLEWIGLFEIKISRTVSLNKQIFYMKMVADTSTPHPDDWTMIAKVD